MKSEDIELEPQVVQGLENMIARYQQLDELTQAMIAKQERGQSIEMEVEQMNHQRNQLMELEQQSQPANDAYRASREHASAGVNLLTEQAATLIAKVIATIAKLEDSARVSYERLTPEINRSVKGNQMKQAYGSSGS